MVTSVLPASFFFCEPSRKLPVDTRSSSVVLSCMAVDLLSASIAYRLLELGDIPCALAVRWKGFTV